MMDMRLDQSCNRFAREEESGRGRLKTNRKWFEWKLIIEFSFEFSLCKLWLSSTVYVKIWASGQPSRSVSRSIFVVKQ